MNKQRLLESLIVGTVLLIPVLATYFFLKMAIGFMDFWREVFLKFAIEEYYFGIMGLFMTLLVVIFIGYIATSNLLNGKFGKLLMVLLDGLLMRIPFINKVWEIIKKCWRAIRQAAKRIMLILKGGYKRIIYEQYGRGTKRWKPAFVIGKTVFETGKSKKAMLVIITPNLSLPDAMWIPPEDTKIIGGGVSKIGLFILSGGFVNPDLLSLEEWTEDKYNEIPEYEE